MTKTAKLNLTFLILSIYFVWLYFMKVEEKINIITINSPESLNALNGKTIKEISGALLFLSAKDGQTALLNSENFLKAEMAKESTLTKPQVERLLDVLASVEILIENIRNKQPIIQKMFDIALTSSQNLKASA